MKDYIVTVEINGLFDVSLKANSLEHALELAKEIEPKDVIKTKTKKIDIIDWEARKITSVFER